MIGYYRRSLQVLVRFLPFALAFLRDRRRFVLFGRARRIDEETHRRRAERIRNTMLDLGPAFIKVGQGLSTRPDIVPPTSSGRCRTKLPKVRAAIRGPSSRRHSATNSTIEPVAGGSLAFAYVATLDDERIALKVRRPGVKELIERDLRVLRGFQPLIGLFADEPARRRVPGPGNHTRILSDRTS